MQSANCLESLSEEDSYCDVIAFLNGVWTRNVDEECNEKTFYSMNIVAEW